MLKIVHPLAGAIALLTILTFLLSTILAELFGSEALIASVKTAIPWGFLLLIPALMTAGGTGFALSKGSRAGVVGAKRKRMPFIAPTAFLFSFPLRFFWPLRRARESSIQGFMPCR